MTVVWLPGGAKQARELHCMQYYILQYYILMQNIASTDPESR